MAEPHLHPTPVGADPSAVADYAAGLPENHLRCRELGHNWKPWVARWNADQRAYERALRCTRCTTKRWETLSATGAKLASHYEYPDGYLAEHLGRIVGEGRDALRLESLTRDLARYAASGKPA